MAIRLAVLTAAYRRPRTTALVLDYFRTLDLPSTEVAARLAVASGPCERWDGWRYLDAPNRPLGRKWNAGMQALRDADVDAVLVVGSDDLVTPDYLAYACRLISEGVDVVYPGRLYVAEGSRVYWAQTAYVGAGRVLSRRALDAAQWKPWPDPAERYLDGLMRARLLAASPDLREHVIRPARPAGENRFVVLDIKTEGENMWSVEEMQEHVNFREIRDGPAWIRFAFPDHAERVLALEPAYATA